MVNNKILLSGTWEQSSKNPLLAAFILVFIVGGVYSFFGSLIVNVYIIIDAYVLHGLSGISGDMDFIELMKAYYMRYKYSILIFRKFIKSIS